MKITQTAIADVLIVEPNVFGDDRGFFFESFNQKVWLEKTGIERSFVQDNHSRSVKGVLRGLHYQIKQPQGKLVRVVAGEVYDVAVDIRKSSTTFGQWVGIHLSEQNKKQLWIPEGFAHGFLVLSEGVEFLYRTTDYWAPAPPVHYPFCSFSQVSALGRVPPRAISNHGSKTRERRAHGRTTVRLGESLLPTRFCGNRFKIKF